MRYSLPNVTLSPVGLLIDHLNCPGDGKSVNGDSAITESGTKLVRPPWSELCNVVQWTAIEAKRVSILHPAYGISRTRRENFPLETIGVSTVATEQGQEPTSPFPSRDVAGRQHRSLGYSSMSAYVWL